MNNKLESFIKDNKKRFEEKGPSEELWNKIAADLGKKGAPKTIKLYRWMSVAAVLILGIGIYFGYSYRSLNKNIEVADINPTLAKKEVRFASMIEEKRDSLSSYAKANPELYQEFTTDLGRLDRDYEDLKKKLQTSVNREMVVKAMMKNREIQLQILTQQLSIITQVDAYKKDSSL